MALVEAMRPRQWTKNLLLFIGLVFAFKLGDARSVLLAVAAFGVFCAVSSAGYLFNDLGDVEQDRQHPRKRNRPIASGRLGRGTAIAAAVLLAVGGMAAAFAINLPFGLITLGYVLLSAAYNAFLKHVVLLDLFALAAFYVARAAAGALAIDVPISPWLYLCTILAALFLGLAKRRHELMLLGDEAAGHRQILGEYSATLLEQLITIVTASLVMAYSLYTFFVRDQTMMVTIPIVLYGIFRYLYLVHQRQAGGSPEDALLGDRPLLLTVAAVGAVSVAVLYLRA